MRSVSIVFCVLCAILFMAVNASADMTIKDYLAMKNDEKKSIFVDFYVQGIGEGTGWSNTLLEEKKQPLLYCQPRKLALDYKDFKKIIDGKIENLRAAGKFKEDWPIGLILMIGLQEAYPCDK